MGDLRDLTINVAAAGISFALGTGVRASLRRLRTLRVRRFWGSVSLRGKTVLVLGSFRRWTSFEPTGLIGTGDTHAIRELTKLFADLNLDFSMEYADSLRSGDTRQNLILLGSEDINALVERVMNRVNATFRTRSTAAPANPSRSPEDEGYEPTLEIVDTRTGRTHTPSWQGEPGKDGGEVVVDYGVVLRVRNPYNSNKSIVVLAGVYGYGTWAAVELIGSKEFEARAKEIQHYNLECLYRVDVLNGTIIGRHIMELRELAPWDSSTDGLQELEPDARTTSRNLPGDGDYQGAPTSTEHLPTQG